MFYFHSRVSFGGHPNREEGGRIGGRPHLPLFCPGFQLWNRCDKSVGFVFGSSFAPRIFWQQLTKSPPTSPGGMYHGKYLFISYNFVDHKKILNGDEP